MVLGQKALCAGAVWACALCSSCAPSQPATTASAETAKPAEAKKPPQPNIDCTPLPDAEAEALLAEANALIDEAGEHPEPEALAEILPKLRKAAYGGLADAQLRYGAYVVGYYATDEMFWPRDRATAIGALGLLRVAVLRDRASAEDYPGLEQTPPDASSPFIQLLDPEWLTLGLEEARAYEACVAAL